MENNLLNHRVDDTISNLFHYKIYTSLSRPLIGDDECINKMGSHRITYASAGIKKPWQMKRENLTPSYTTSWKHIPVVKAI